jgi:hypothetical protein
MGRSAISKYLSAIAKRGGEARAKSLTAAERKAIATKASKAAAKARRTKAAQQKRSGQIVRELGSLVLEIDDKARACADYSQSAL